MAEIRAASVLPARREEITLHTQDGLELVGELALPADRAPVATLVCLVFKNAGAYCFEMSSNYNSRYKPAEILVDNGQAKLIRKADVFEDLLRNQL